MFAKRFGVCILALILALSAQIIWSLTGYWLEELRSRWSHGFTVHEQVGILYDGTPIIYKMTSPNDYAYYLLDGTQIKEKLDFVHEGMLYAPVVQVKSNYDWNQRIEAYASESPRGFWYLIHDGQPNGLAYFEGFHPESKVRLGYLGKTGLSQNRPSPQDQFRYKVRRARPYEPWSELIRIHQNHSGETKIFVLNSDEALEFNLNQGSVRSIWKGKDACDETLVNDASHKRYLIYNDDSIKQRRVIRTSDRLIFLSQKHEIEKTVILPETLRRKNFQLLNFPQGGFLLLTGKHFFSPVDNEYARFYWFDNQGKIEKTQEIEDNNAKSEVTLSYWLRFGAIVPSPTIFLSVVVRTRFMSDIPDYASAEIATEYAKAWPALLIISILSLGLAVFVYRRQKALDQGSPIGWAIFVFLFGLAGLAGYWWHRRWPVCVACPRCQKVVPRDRNVCLACRQEFPGPEPLSTEIRMPA